MHSHHSSGQENKGWRSNWFVKNILAEIPIIGGFFHSADIPHALHYAGKSAAMLAGGSIGMMLEILKKSDTDTMTTRMAKDTTNMAMGMALGNIAYNTLYSIGSSICCKNSENPKAVVPSPKQTLVEEIINLDEALTTEVINTNSTYQHN